MSFKWETSLSMYHNLNESSVTSDQSVKNKILIKMITTYKNEPITPINFN